MDFQQTTLSVYQFLCDYHHQHHRSPSIREICQACFLSAPTVYRHLDKLESFGWIAREPHTARSIIILKEGMAQEPIP